METTSYCRVSMEDQVKEGVSLAGQEARVRAYCVVAGLSLVESIRDEGVSTSLTPASSTGSSSSSPRLSVPTPSLGPRPASNWRSPPPPGTSRLMHKCSRGCSCKAHFSSCIPCSKPAPRLRWESPPTFRNGLTHFSSGIDGRSRRRRMTWQRRWSQPPPRPPHLFSRTWTPSPRSVRGRLSRC
jgi:Resolvase, N terminal domain